MTVSTTYALAITPYQEDECAICLEEFSPTDPIYLLACAHLFHPDCLQGQGTCPTCRAPIQPFVIKREPGHGFYQLLHQLVTHHKNKDEWTPHEIDEIASALGKELSKHHEWNRYLKLSTFNNLCLSLKKPTPSAEEAARIEIFFQELIQHKNFQKISNYLQQQSQNLPEDPEETDSFWNLITRVATMGLCLPPLQQPE